MPPSQPAPEITTVILAGGRGVRIGGNKGLQLLRGKPLLAWVLEKIRPHSAEILINANGDPAGYAQFGYPVVADVLPDWQGPLAGLHAALQQAQHDYVLTVPCDTPFLPDDLLPQLWRRLQASGADAVVAVAQGKRQPALALYRRQVLPALEAFLQAGGRKVNAWLDSLQLAEQFFVNEKKFNNINTLEDLRAAECEAGDRESIMTTQKIIGFAGFSGSGKTTLLEQVIPLLRARGLCVAVIKHAHHKFDIDKPGKDSFRHREAGAREVMVVSGFRWALMHELVDEAEPSLEALCSRLTPCDLVLVEGYKFSNIPKIEVHRRETGHPQLYREDRNFVAMATDAREDIGIPVLDINRPQQVADFIINYFSLEQAT